MWCELRDIIGGTATVELGRDWLNEEQGTKAVKKKKGKGGVWFILQG